MNGFGQLVIQVSNSGIKLSKQLWIMFNTLWPIDAIWRHTFRSSLSQIITWCLVAHMKKRNNIAVSYKRCAHRLNPQFVLGDNSFLTINLSPWVHPLKMFPINSKSKSMFTFCTYSGHIYCLHLILLDRGRFHLCSLGLLPLSFKCSFVLLCHFMMTSSNGNKFRVAGHMCGEFIGDRWIPPTKASDAELGCYLRSAPE